MVYCTQCGKKLNPKEKFCSNCGTQCPITEETREERVFSWKATLALILGILSVVSPLLGLVWPVPMGVLGIVSGIVAIIFAILSRKETNRRLSVMALFGLILGILGLCISLIVLIFAIAYLLMAPFLPDLTDATEIYFWLYENFGEEAAQVFEQFMFLWE